MSLAKVMIVAGSDSGGGAGIQADLKAVAALGGHGMTAITALTAQNTTGVSGVHPVPLEFVEQQFRAVADDIGFDAVKTGMLHSAELTVLVARLLEGCKAPVVVDPVMVAKGGSRLLAADAVKALKEHLLPKASLVTPNLDEAEELLGHPVRDPGAMGQAAKQLVALGAKAALVKGGHLDATPCDVLYDGTGLHLFSASRLDTPHTHGTGCTLASACATLLGQGMELPKAVERARILVRRAIMAGLAIGQGRGPVHAMADLAPRLELGQALKRMEDVIAGLESSPGLGRLIPEIRGQLAWALPGAVSYEDVVAVAGRLTNHGGRLIAGGPAMAGASRHVAKIVLAASAFDPEKRAAFALLYDEALLEKARKLGWSVGEFSRADEPREVKELEGSTLEWGTQKTIAEMGMVPDMIFDKGEVGKEPVIRLLAKDPEDVAAKLLTLARDGE